MLMTCQTVESTLRKASPSALAASFNFCSRCLFIVFARYESVIGEKSLLMGTAPDKGSMSSSTMSDGVDKGEGVSSRRTLAGGPEGGTAPDKGSMSSMGTSTMSDGVSSRGALAGGPEGGSTWCLLDISLLKRHASRVTGTKMR